MPIFKPFMYKKNIYEIDYKKLKDMGVKFEVNKKLGTDFTVDTLKEQGYQAFYFAIGKPDEIEPPFPIKGALTSHEFLFSINKVLKLKQGTTLQITKIKKC